MGFIVLAKVLYSLSDTSQYPCFSPVAVPGMASKVTTRSRSSVPFVSSSTLTSNVLPSVTLIIDCRETRASTVDRLVHILVGICSFDD